MTDTVTVKPLVWDANHASTEIGLYAYYTGFPHKDGDTVVQLNEKIIGYGHNKDEAEAAAQADYERRILSALEPQTPAQAARVLLDKLENSQEVRQLAWAATPDAPGDFGKWFRAALRAIAGGE